MRAKPIGKGRVMKTLTIVLTVCLLSSVALAGEKQKAKPVQKATPVQKTVVQKGDGPVQKSATRSCRARRGLLGRLFRRCG